MRRLCEHNAISYHHSKPMKTVLAPIDFSPITELVVDEAVVLAEALGARLVLFNAVAPAAVRKAEATDRSMESQYVLGAEKFVLGELLKWQRRLRDEGVTAHTVHRIGAAGPQILEQAERLDADYIVMGSHGHGALYDLLAGSTTARVLKKAKCSVAIVPPGATTSEPRQSGRRRRISDVHGQPQWQRSEEEWPTVASPASHRCSQSAP